MIRFWPRSPRFPVIIDTSVALVGARRAAECSKLIERAGFARSERATPVIDSTADGYGFYAQLLMISPLVSKSRWTKSEIISLYNSRREPWAPEYPSTALGNKAVGRVVAASDLMVYLTPVTFGG